MNRGIKAFFLQNVILCATVLLSRADALITNPPLPVVRSVAAVYRPGAVISIAGSANGEDFQSFHVEWAKGINPASGWTNTAVTLTGGGISPITNDSLAHWNSGTVTQADFYSIRLRVVETSVTNTSSTYVYLEPDLYSANWPQWLDQSPGNSSVQPARSASGQTYLILVNPPYIGTTLPSRLWQFALDGSSVTTNNLDNASYMQPAVANLDDAAGDEIIVAEWNHLRVFRPDGSSYVLPLPNTSNLQRVLVTLADLDGDGQLEILGLGSTLMNTDAWLYAWKTNGQMFTTNYPVLVPDANINLRTSDTCRLIPVDVNADGIPELLAIGGDNSSSFSLRMFQADGTPANWPVITKSGRYYQVLSGDLDGDHLPEIVLGYADGGGTNRLQVYCSQGTLLRDWPVVYGGAPMCFLMADLDRDSMNEIVATVYSILFVFRSDGSKFPGSWPVQGDAYQTLSMPATEDIDGDGIAEILVLRNNLVLSSPYYKELNLLAYRTNGTVARSWLFFGANSNQPMQDGSPPLIGDFDEDGNVDIAINYRLISGGGISGSVREGVASVLRLSAPYLPDRRDWPMYYHDTRNSSAGFMRAKLQMTGMGNNRTLSWPLQSDAAVVQFTDDLKSNVWNLLPASVSLSNGLNTVSFQTTNTHRWFRLQYP